MVMAPLAHHGKGSSLARERAPFGCAPRVDATSIACLYSWARIYAAAARMSAECTMLELMLSGARGAGAGAVVVKVVNAEAERSVCVCCVWLVRSHSIDVACVARAMDVCIELSSPSCTCFFVLRWFSVRVLMRVALVREGGM